MPEIKKKLWKSFFCHRS